MRYRNQKNIVMSKYSPLADFLATQQQDEIQMSFSDIEKILKFNLPPVARNNDAWWANSRTDDSHTHAHLWIRAGWQSQKINRSEGWIVFRQINSRLSKQKVSIKPPAINPSVELRTDLLKILSQPDIPETTRESLIDARLGQGKYRQELLNKWNNRCAVTGCDVLNVIRASHVKPWSKSDPRERLDPNNGIPLIANLDALFDIGLISFASDGNMLVSDFLTDEQRIFLGIPAPLSATLNTAQLEYLNFHRSYFFPKK
jgi:hypothetical protein